MGPPLLDGEPFTTTAPRPDEDLSPREGRRRFLKQIGTAVLAVSGMALGEAIASPPATAAEEAGTGVEAPSLSPAVTAGADENMMLRMQKELATAMKKPIAERRWTMVIDLRKCIGCDACTVACKAENHLPPGVVYRPVIKEEVGKYPNVSLRFVPRPCMQCDDPPCVPVCPVGATYKRPDGIVEINYNKCIGCRYCVTACPYQARTFDFGDYYTRGIGIGSEKPEPYETSPAMEYGRSWDRTSGGSPIGNVRKCQFCVHRLEAGMLPACVTSCVGTATYFGDANDPTSMVSDLMNRPNAQRLKDELGTHPKVYYLV